MDPTTRTLLIELARTVLRLLGDSAKEAPVKPASTTAPTTTPAPAPTPASTPVPEVNPRNPHNHVHGDAVRFWDGNKYVCGTVVSVCRQKTGHPPRVNVRVEKSSGRGKTYTIESAKAEKPARGGVA